MIQTRGDLHGVGHVIGRHQVEQVEAGVHGQPGPIKSSSTMSYFSSKLFKFLLDAFIVPLRFELNVDHLSSQFFEAESVRNNLYPWIFCISVF